MHVIDYCIIPITPPAWKSVVFGFGKEVEKNRFNTSTLRKLRCLFKSKADHRI